jgi:thermostable 8-oxoguanine DNA glycosylase
MLIRTDIVGSENLHPIDRPNGKYSDKELDKFLIFCMLDRAQPYAKVCKAFDALSKEGIVSRTVLEFTSVEEIASILKSTGYRFPNQTARFLHEFGKNQIDLKTATRDDLVKNIKGIGPKLASMFLRNTRGAVMAVLDIHTRRWMAEKGYDPKMPYDKLEAAFIEEAKKLGKDPRTLDLEIWEERRLKPKELVEVNKAWS